MVSELHSQVSFSLTQSYRALAVCQAHNGHWESRQARARPFPESMAESGRLGAVVSMCQLGTSQFDSHCSTYPVSGGFLLLYGGEEMEAPRL